MKQEQQPGKRIVSKIEYAKVQGLRAGMTLGASFLLVLCIGCVGVALLLLCCLVYSLVVLFTLPRAGIGYGVLFTCMLTALTALFGAGSFYISRLFRKTLEETDRMDNVVPLTRANSVYLPTPDSLVRASQEPMQAQEAVLLRAAVGEAQQGQEAQLLKAAGEQAQG